jgi:hypothetical protein
MSGGYGGSRQLLHAIALLGLLAIALASAAIAHETPPASGEADSAALERLSVAVTPKVAERVERIRGLQFEEVPQPQVVDAEFMNELGARDARRSGAARGLAVDEASARLLGLLPADEGLEAVIESTGDLAAAAYDPRTDRLYMITGVGALDRTLVEFFLAHELTHALEDQHFGLPHSPDTSDDGALAELALIEGTATAVMIEYARLHLNPGELLAASLEIDAGRGDVPAFVVEQLELAYLRGAEFVQELNAVGDGWTLVDDAFANRPPSSTEQVLHPETYLEVEAPVPTGVEAPALERRGWQRLGGGDLGEAATAQLLRVGAPPEIARQAAEGWGGDHYALWARDRSDLACASACVREFVLAIRWRWDSPAEAQEFAQALPAYLLAGLDAQRIEADTFELPDGWADVQRRSRSVSLALAPTAHLARLAGGGP